MVTREELDGAIKALEITENTVLFVDLYRINRLAIERCDQLPRGLVVVGVSGPPNVEAMTREELQAILDLKPAPSAGL